MTSPATESGTGVLAGEERLFIDGTLTGATSGAVFEVINPATEEVAGVAADGRPADFDRAIAAARRPLDSNAGGWRDDVEFRARCVTQLRDGLIRAQERLRRVLVTEIGTPIAMTHRIPPRTSRERNSGSNRSRRRAGKPWKPCAARQRHCLPSEEPTHPGTGYSPCSPTDCA
jgi:acyl-CoA reductase-like NAD-dependent aldehyde dehydrogenase